MLKIFIITACCMIFTTFNVYAQSTSEAISNEQMLFEEALEMLRPLTDEQIILFREFSRQQEEAISAAIPSLHTRTVQVTLEPGEAPTRVFTTPNTVTALVFHDITGQPWEITSLTNGSPNSFQVLKPEIPEGNLVNILPLMSNASTSIIVTLKDKDIPLVLAVQSDNINANARSADSMLLVQLAHMGPSATIPVIERITPTVSSTLIAFLDQVPPDGARLLNLSASIPNLKIWEYEENIYIRTEDLLIFPSWTASVNGAGDFKCYEIANTNSRILLSVNGTIQTIDLGL